MLRRSNGTRKQLDRCYRLVIYFFMTRAFVTAARTIMLVYQLPYHISSIIQSEFYSQRVKIDLNLWVSTTKIQYVQFVVQNYDTQLLGMHFEICPSKRSLSYFLTFIRPNLPFSRRTTNPFKSSDSRLFMVNSEWTTRRALIFFSTILVSAIFSASESLLFGLLSGLLTIGGGRN